MLGVDASRAAGARTGVGRYLEYLLREWSLEKTPFEQIRVFTPSATGVVPSGGPFEEVVLPGSGRFGWQVRRLRRAAADVDVLFAPYATPVGLRPPAVVANLGIYEGEHAIAGLRSRAQSRHFGYAARRAAAVVANSASTRAELVRHYRVDERKVTVAWPGIDERFRLDRALRVTGQGARLLGEAAPYLLFVGKLSHRRNVPAVVESLARLTGEHPRLRLLVVGHDTTGVDVPGRARQLGLADRVRHVEHVDQDVLADLYRGAAAFVLPTEAEGFSFTILEALASGAPVVTLRHAALVEAGLDEAVIALDDASPEAIAQAVDSVLSEPTTDERLRRLGPERSAPFSWAENARRTMAVIADVAGGV